MNASQWKEDREKLIRELIEILRKIAADEKIDAATRVAAVKLILGR